VAVVPPSGGLPHRPFRRGTVSRALPGGAAGGGDPILAPMDAMELLLGRRSNPKLADPAPDGPVLDRILQAALAAPDHGALRTTRILTIRGAARERLGEAIAEMVRRKDPGADDETLSRARRKPLRAPLLLAVAARPVPDHPKVPVIEQVLSAGTAAHALLLAVQAEGFAGIWRTGEPAYDPGVKEALGLRGDDELVAFLYVGTPTVPAPTAPRPALDEVVSAWEG